jgi:hypothetical protein
MLYPEGVTNRFPQRSESVSPRTRGELVPAVVFTVFYETNVALTQSKLVLKQSEKVEGTLI